MLLLNSLNAEEKWQSAIRGTLWEINRRKEVALEDGLIPLRYKGVKND